MRGFLAAVLTLVAAEPEPAPPLPVVEVDWPAFRRQTRDLIERLDRLGAPLPLATAKALGAVLDDDRADPAVAARTAQRLLDRQCLVRVHINPESRVKAARGPRKADLVRDEPTVFLVKVHNQGGVTHPLAVASDQAVRPGRKGPDRWVEAAVVNGGPFPRRLAGRPLEYRAVRLTARQAGKREATLVFDVGQGSQDLGFRAEVPILFAVRDRR